MDMPITIAALAITPQMLSLIAEIDEFKGAWRALGTLAPGRITNSQVVEVTGANRNTVKKHLQMLVSDNHLVQHGSGKATYYSRV